MIRVYVESKKKPEARKGVQEALAKAFKRHALLEPGRSTLKRGLIVVSPSHRLSVALVCHLGNHTLVVTNDYGEPSAFELVAPVMKDGAALPDEEPEHSTIILDHDEVYNLYQCLHVLFGKANLEE